VSLRKQDTRLRADVGYLGRINEHGQPMTCLVEVKSCLADLQADHKWVNYTDRSHSFCFAGPPDVMREINVGARWGLIEVTESSVRVLRDPDWLDGIGWEILADTLYGFALANRGESR
jgi:hypothetical protein